MRVSAVMLVALNFWRTREFNVFSRDAIERVRVVEMLREFVMRRPMRHREPRRGHSRSGATPVPHCCAEAPRNTGKSNH